MAARFRDAAERPEITQAALTAACAGFLTALGFTDISDCAEDMAATAIEAAAGWPPGTVLGGRY